METTIDVSPVKQWLQGFIQMGIPRQALITALGVDPQILETHDARVPVSGHQRMLEFGVNASGIPGLALKMGSQTTAENMGIVGHLMMNSETVLEAGKHIVRYAKILAESNDWKIHKHFRQYQIELDVIGPAEVSSMGIEASLGSTIGMLRFLSSHPIKALSIELTYPDPGYSDVYEEIFGVKASFDCPKNILAIAEQDALRPVTHHQPYVLDLLKNHAEQLLENLSGDETLNAEVSRIITNNLNEGRFDIDWVSGQLDMSRWTLTRKLKAEGTTFNEVLKTVRSSLAKTYLQQSGYSVTEIAFLLGYSEASAFQRACKSWFNCSPAVYRKQFFA